ncbi:MAG: hypothetical protein GYB68_12880 [Chloroflexi bacterium]|nr:hypothetical protein [Chloroflexota bacterium]
MLKNLSIEQFLATSDRQTVSLVIGMALGLSAALIGVLLALLGPLWAAAILVALVGGVWMVSSLTNALYTVIAIICLLPFATVPFKIVLTPTLLDIAMGTAVGLYLIQWMTGERRELKTTPVHPFVVVFAALTVFSFVAGLRHAGINTTILRRFAELILSIGFGLMLVDILREAKQIKHMVLAIAAGGVAASLVGIVLWVLPDGTAANFLVRLSIIGYPDAGVIQYIESNPALSERAIGTSVNPNALGGLLVLMGALIAPHAFSDQPLTGKRWHALAALVPVFGCLVLTFSRGSMLSFVVAIGVIALLRYPRLLILGVVAGAVFIVLPFTQEYIVRFIEGFQGADLATQMRFGEYQDAILLITRYPLLGVGFIGAPDIDIYLGVANVYLTIGSNMGLLGLSAFLLTMGAIFVYAWQARPRDGRPDELDPIWLGLLAGLVSVLFNGIFDHYFFNLEFHFAVTIFWIYIGLLLATSRVLLTSRSGDEAAESVQAQPDSAGVITSEKSMAV